jgi:hypothetical protein
MSVRNLKKKSGTDWARIDRMTDDEIDISDIPPLDDSFFKSAKWILPRWLIDLRDFRQAREFASHILSQHWHSKKKTELRRLKHTAFNTSLIVAYSRPFHNNRNLKGEPESSLKKQAAAILNEAELKLHQKVLRLRDNVYAHSAASVYRLQNHDYSSNLIPIMRLVENLDESEVRLLKSITRKWIDSLERKRTDFKRRLAEAIQNDS